MGSTQLYLTATSRNLIVRDHTIITVSALANPDDVTSWFNIEALEFSDTTFTLEYDAPTDQIATIYDRVLPRQADREGLQYLAISNSQGTSIGSIAMSVLSSQERLARGGSALGALYTASQVDALYQVLLGRQADTEGKAYWLNILSHGARLDEVATAFVLSTELTQAYGGPESWDFMT